MPEIKPLLADSIFDEDKAVTEGDLVSLVSLMVYQAADQDFPVNMQILTHAVDALVEKSPEDAKLLGGGSDDAVSRTALSRKIYNLRSHGTLVGQDLVILGVDPVSGKGDMLYPGPRLFSFLMREVALSEPPQVEYPLETIPGRIDPKLSRRTQADLLIPALRWIHGRQVHSGKSSTMSDLIQGMMETLPVFSKGDLDLSEARPTEPRIYQRIRNLISNKILTDYVDIRVDRSGNRLMSLNEEGSRLLLDDFFSRSPALENALNSALDYGIISFLDRNKISHENAAVRQPSP